MAQTVTISGNNAVRVLYAGNSLTLNNITIANGYVTIGTVGGGIYHCCSGALTITNSTFSGNQVDWVGEGGAIYNYFGALTISDSTFSGNSAGNGAWTSGGGAAVMTRSALPAAPSPATVPAVLPEFITSTTKAAPQPLRIVPSPATAPLTTGVAAFTTVTPF